jgi:ketosteroid isomerase-like protein
MGKTAQPLWPTVMLFGSQQAYNGRMNGSPESIAQAFVRAINRQDVEGLAVLMTREHRFVDSLGNTVVGREKMRAGWAAYFRMIPDYSIAVDESFCDGPVVLMLSVVEGTYSPDGKLKAENRWKTPAAFRVQVEDGLVAEWRVYADNEPIRALMRKNAPGAA